MQAAAAAATKKAAENLVLTRGRRLFCGFFQKISDFKSQQNLQFAIFMKPYIYIIYLPIEFSLTLSLFYHQRAGRGISLHFYGHGPQEELRLTRGFQKCRWLKAETTATTHFLELGKSWKNCIDMFGKWF